MKELTLNGAQQQVDNWIQTVGVRYFNELTNLGILIEETGELAKLMVRIYGEQSFKMNDAAPKTDAEKKQLLSDEMADVLWVLLCLANQTGINLTDALHRNFEKKSRRDATRHLQNDKLK